VSKKNKPASPVQVANKQSKTFINASTLSIILTSIFFLLSLIGVYNHEPWRDEFQAYLLGRESNSFSDLFNNIKYEGHPPLWHIILFIQTRFIDSIFLMQLIHSLFATATVFILLRFFTFKIYQKILIPFGYFFIYEFNLIARNYILAIFFFVLAIFIYKKYFISYLTDVTKELKIMPFIFLGITIFLLALSSVFGLIMIGCIWCLLFIDIINLIRQNRLTKQLYKISIPLLIFSIIGILVSYNFIKAEPDNSYPINYTKGYSQKALEYSLSKITTNYFPVLPTKDELVNIGERRFWNLNIYIDPKTGFEKDFVFKLSLIFLIPCLLFFFNNQRVLLFYLCGTFGILAFIYLTNMRPLRYSGNMYCILILSVGLSNEYEKMKPLFSYSISKKLVASIFTVFFTASLSANAFAGLNAYYQDLLYPFSNTTRAGKYVVDNNLRRLPIMGSSDFVISPLTYYTHNPVLMPESDRYQNFIIWNKERKSNTLGFQDIIDLMVKQIDSVKVDTMILVLNTELTYVKNNITYGFTEDNLYGTDVRLKAIHREDEACIVGDEKYYFYLGTKSTQLSNK
jgi:hypothetical protein